MSIKGHKIFIYNDYPGKEIDAVVKLTINIGGIVRDGFMYEMSRMKDQDLIFKTSWLRDVGTWIKLKGPTLIFPELNVRILYLLLILDI